MYFARSQRVEIRQFAPAAIDKKKEADEERKIEKSFQQLKFFVLEEIEK